MNKLRLCLVQKYKWMERNEFYNLNITIACGEKYWFLYSFWKYKTKVIVRSDEMILPYPFSEGNIICTNRMNVISFLSAIK